MIIYFTGTGNSRYIAQTIQKATGYPAVDAAALIKKGDYSELADCHPFVIIFPIYAGRMPKPFWDFLTAVPLKGTDRAYFICTCAGSSGSTIDSLRNLCSSVLNMEFMGFMKIIMPSNMPMSSIKAPSECQETIAEGRDKALSAVPFIQQENPFPPFKEHDFIMSLLVNPLFTKFYKPAAGFGINEKCIGCGQCAALCPMNNIRLINQKPQWGKNCCACMGCINSCPQGAIEYKNKTQGKPRYYLKDGFKL
jgi:ferredoxin/flavodoxin